MEDEEKKNNIIFTAESIVNSNYRDLFREIGDCGMRDWMKKDGTNVPDLKHPLYPPPYLRLDFRHLFDFLKARADIRIRKLQLEIDKSSIQWETFRQGRNRNVSNEVVTTGICTASRFLKIPLISLLAQFLEDCESKKIRLFSYAEYEKTITDFLREAPDIVKRLQSKSPQFFTPDKQEQQLPEQVVTENRYRIDRVEGEEKWLDPYNFNELPLVGREKEFELLNRFIETEEQFKIWAIAGPSGSGKTRLASQWAYDLPARKGWDCRVLHKEDRAEPKKWAKWSPDKPTLVIIDYMYGFEAVIQKLMNHRFKPDTPKIRLLLIDHVFSEPLHSDERWGFTGDGSSLNRNEKYFFDTKPLDLRQTQDQETIIKSIIVHRAGINKKSEQVDIAHKYLQETQGAYHPLFAALVGDAIKSDKNFTQWNRRELIDYYLSGDDRLPWEHGNDSGRWASHFTTVATARRRIYYRDLIAAAGNCTSSPEHFDEVKAICQKIVTDNNTEILKPFEPDILGESFFLKFLQFLENSPAYQKEFRQIFIAGNEDTQIEDATEFIAFIQRLTRNLLNDDQNQKETQALWNALFKFMNPSDFESAKPIQWAMTIGLIDMIVTIKDLFSEEMMITLLNQIDPDVLYRDNNKTSLRKSILHSMRYFELTHRHTEVTPEIPEEMLELFDRLTANDTEALSVPIIIASFLGFNKTACALVNRGVDTKAIFDGGQNALIIASLMGHTEIVQCLLKAKEKPEIDATDKHGLTALIWASNKGKIEAVRLLLGAGANINAADNRGLTVLIWASLKGHIDIVRLLLDDNKEGNTNIRITDKKSRAAFIWASFRSYIVRLLLYNKGSAKADINIADKKSRTALIWASGMGQIETVRLLLHKKANINSADEEGHTALIWASLKGHIEVVELLLNEGANIDIADKAGHTALIRACMSGHIKTVKLLLHKRADTNIADKEGRTALIWASFYGEVEIADLLLGEGTNIDFADIKGRTALMCASINGHTKTVRLLIDKGANPDIVDNNGNTALMLIRCNM